MADIKFYKVTALPSPSDANAVYFVKSGSATKIYITDTTGTPYGANGVDAVVSSVNALNGNVQLELSLSGGSLSITGGTTPVNLDNRYLKTTDSIAWSKITGQPTTLGGYGITDAYTKSEVTAITGALSNLNTSTKASLVAAINELNSALADQLDVPDPIDCSTNPNYPASNKGDTYKVTVAGKIGGDNGVNVGVGDLIICTANTSGGDQTAAGSSFFVVESNVDMATDAVAGLGRIATQAEVTGGAEDKAWVTPATLNSYLDDNYYDKTTSDSRYLQSFTEIDPEYTSDKDIIYMDRGSIPPNTDIDNFLEYGSYYHGSSSTGTTNDPFVAYSFFGLSRFGYYLRFAASSSSSAPKAQWGSKTSVGPWRDMVFVGSKISSFDNDAGYITSSSLHDPVTLGTEKNGLSLSGQELQLSTATTSAAGAMSAADKTKLDGVANNANNYSLPKATTSVLGGVIVGTRLSVDANGEISADVQTENNFTDTLLAKLNGIAANANNYTLPKASASVLGGIKVGNNLSIDANGVLSASDSTYSAGTGLDLTAGEFSLLPATAAALGGVKIGTRLSITAGGTLSADKQMVWAATPEW